jgi:thiopurine S-methyltransferase
MHPDFWHERWRAGQIGFHQEDVNPRLIEHWGALGLGAGEQVLVPLSGKSRDMSWLRAQGHPVLGVELSPIPVGEFFEEAGLPPRAFEQGPFSASEAGEIRLLQGNVFDLRREDLAAVRGVYDRAAIVALPPELRRDYVRLLTDQLPERVSILLISFETDPDTGIGPPFAVSEREIRELFEPSFRVEVLARTVSDPPTAAIRARGVQTVHDVAYAIRR